MDEHRAVNYLSPRNLAMYSLVIENYKRDFSHTRDLFPCAEILLDIIPNTLMLWKAVAWAVNPISDSDFLEPFLRRVASWFMRELEAQ